MIVQCDKCGAKYRFDDSKIGLEGITVRCSRCKNVFKVLHPLSLDEKEIFGVREDSLEGLSFEEWGKEFTEKPSPSQTEDIPPITKEGPPPKAFIPPAPEEIFPEEEEAVEELPALEEELFPGTSPVLREIPEEKERKASRTILLSILLLVLIFGAFYYWNKRGISLPLFETIYEKISRLMGGKADQEIFLLYLKGAEHTLEGGKVFVIQGKVANRSQKAKRLVKLKGLLFSKDGRTLATSIGYGGHTISNEEVKNSTYDSLKSSFGFPSTGQARPVSPQESVPFTIIFFSPPAGAVEYQVTITEEGLGP